MREVKPENITEISTYELRGLRARLEEFDELSHYHELALRNLEQIEAPRDSLSDEFRCECVLPAAKYLSVLQAINREFDFTDSIVYAPGHGADVSHCEAFFHSKQIINLELDPLYVAMMRRFYWDAPHIKSVLGDVDCYQPNPSPQVVVIFGAAFDTGAFIAKSFIQEGALIVSRHTLCRAEAASHLRQVAIFGKERIISSTGDSLLKPVCTDEDLQNFLPKHYKNVLEAVYKSSGKTSALIPEYRALRERALDEALAARMARESSPEWRELVRNAGLDAEELITKDWSAYRTELSQRTLRTTINGEEFRLSPLPETALIEGEAVVYRKVRSSA